MAKQRNNKLHFADNVPRWIRAEAKRAVETLRLSHWELRVEMLPAESMGEGMAYQQTDVHGLMSTAAQYRDGLIQINESLSPSEITRRSVRHEFAHVVLANMEHALFQWLETSGVKLKQAQLDLLFRLYRDAEDGVVEHLLDISAGAADG